MRGERMVRRRQPVDLTDQDRHSAVFAAPKRREPEYESLTLVVDPNTLMLRMLITVDSQGGRSAFTFSNLKENVRIADNQFVFKMPRNVEVTTDGGR